MPNTSFKKYFTKGDRRTAIADTLVDASGTPIDLSSSTVTFRMVKQSDNSVKVNSASATIDSAAAGNVSYSWAAADIDTASDYWYWWIVTTNSKTEHFPGDGQKAAITIVDTY